MRSVKRKLTATQKAEADARRIYWLNQWKINRVHEAAVRAQVREGLSKLDGTEEAALSLLTGLSVERINELGGVGDE